MIIRKVLGVFWAVLMTSQVLGQVYCEPTADCSQNDHINDFVFRTITNTNTNGSNCGFWPFGGTSYINTGIQTNVTQGSNYAFSIATDARPQGFAIWADWNSDGDFNDASEFVWASPNAGTSFSGSITIPLKAKPGNTRLRVRCIRGTTISSNQSCTNFNSGETEDYTLIVAANSQIPQTDFIANVTSATPNCDLQFFDKTPQYVTSYLWDFGDGGSSALANPVHSYSSAGSYTVRLTATNVNGNSTETKTNYISIGGVGLPSANCTPACSTILAGLGVTLFELGTNSVSSADANAGYEDLSCSPFDVTQGETYPISIQSSQTVLQYYRMWIDWNGDGFISNSSELVFSQNNVQSASGTINIPSSAVLNTPIRVRVAGVYYLNAPSSFTPCSGMSNGQMEDHAIIVRPNTKPPKSDFSSDVQNSCNGDVQFQDFSTNVPTQWTWSFGDGNSSNAQNPHHTYASSGTFNVQLIATNTFGSDTIVKNSFVTVTLANNVKPNCSVTTLSHTSDYGIHYVLLQTMNKITGGGEEGYQDYSCTNNLQLMKQTKYPITIKTGDANREDVNVWVDLDDNGVFGSGELLINSLNKNTHNDTLLIPSIAITGNAVRMRISSDFIGSNLGPCDDPTFGQVEDYSLTLSNNPDQVNADLSVDSNISCTGTINFTDQSSNSPTSWMWNFGDGNTSTLQNPVHTYSAPGTYTVSLQVSKGGVSDQAIRTNLVHVISNCRADTIPVNGSAQTLTDCGGRIQDSGGNADYQNNTDGIRTISPANALSLTLTFNIFDFESGLDSLNIYDGPNTSSPLIGSYSGNALPNGGVISSTSNSLTLWQKTNSSGVASGFDASWTCVSAPRGPQSFFEADTTQSCTGLVKFTDLSTNAPDQWAWNFGDGGGSILQDPVHQYISSGFYDVRLIAKNSIGSDTLVKTSYIQVSSAFCAVGIDDRLLTKNDWNAYPNPTTGKITLDLNEFEEDDLSISVLDLSGRILQVEHLRNSENHIHEMKLDHLSAGSYILLLEAGEHKSSKLIFYRP